jgi:hypothetical protein
MNRLGPSAYEEFIAQLVANLRVRHDIGDIKSGAKNRQVGASGVKHQIDVSFRETIIGQEKLVLIECKSLKTGRAVNLGHVKILKATADDMLGISQSSPPVELHLISSVPLQAGAARYAKHYLIQTHVVGDQGNWSFKYGSVAQFGLALQASAAVVAGTASIHRTCSACGTHFQPIASERECSACQTPSVA